MIDSDFWHGKKVFITGHTGFKGSWLSLWLNKMGADVTGLALDPPTTPSLFEVCGVSELLTDIRGDVRDKELVAKSLQDAKPEIVFHLAAQPIVRESFHDPVTTIATNVMGTVNVLEAIRGSNTVQAAVMITTDKVYENQEWIWGYRENEPLGGHDPYSASKACAEILISSFSRSFFNPDAHTPHPALIASVRAGNVIGGGDWATDRLVPDTMKAFIEGKEVVVRNPNATRPWQHVLEPLGGYLLLAQRMIHEGRRHCGAWNFGPQGVDAISVGDVVERLCFLWGGKASCQLGQKSGPHEARFLTLDWTKANVELGWYPRWNVETAFKYIVEWFKAYASGSNMRDVTMKQITSFEVAKYAAGPHQ